MAKIESLTPAQYLESVMRTANNSLPIEQIISNCCISLVEELGEFAGLIKKRIYHEHPITEDKFIAELGDTLFYLFWLGRNVSPRNLSQMFNYTFSKNFVEMVCTLPGASLTNYPQMFFHIQRDLNSVINYAINFLENMKEGLCTKRFEKEFEIASLRYLHSLATVTKLLNINSNFGHIAWSNQQKLMNRYPTGFSTEASINRKE
jgi:hypothetical protein